MHTEPARPRFASTRINHILLASACALVLGAAASPASAQSPPSYYWPEYAPRSVPSYAPKQVPRRANSATTKSKLAHKQAEHVSKLPFGDIPKGPLEIFVSINQQRLHFYSDGVHVADEPVATGVPGHLTPLGVFSVIQRDRYHHSNIYSNAPMPYMERITWSGVALHEGVGLGHPASHGCIRMPHDFAARLWMLPTMGTRVIIARPELKPFPFADPHLFVHKEAPANPMTAPTAALMPSQQSNPALRTDVINDPAAGATANAPSPTSAKANPDKAAPPAEKPEPTGAQASNGPFAAATGATNSDPRPATPADPPVAAASHPADGAASQPSAAEPAKGSTAKAVVPAEPQQNSVAPADGKANQAAAPTAPPQAAPAGTANAPAKPDSSADQTSDDKPPPLPPIRPAGVAHSNGPIAVFVSRKTGKIYVRQNFTPVFDAPVKIDHPEQPIGTHVFTAMEYLPDHSTFRWTVVTLPEEAPKQAEHWKNVKDMYGRARRVRAVERAAEPPPAEAPQDALSRIQIPQDVIDQISRLMVPGSSLIVSDQGLGPETGDGTDFIVVTR